MSFKENKIDSKAVYQGRIFRVEVDNVELPDGRYSTRECIRHSGGAAVLFIKDNAIAIVRQYRYLYNQELYEIPAGKLDYGEDPQAAAMRELKEETGYRAVCSQHLLDIYPTPGYTDEIIHIYYVSHAEFVGQKLDDGEFLNITFIPIDQVLKMINSGIIKDAKTICALYAYLSLQNRILL